MVSYLRLGLGVAVLAVASGCSSETGPVRVDVEVPAGGSFEFVGETEDGGFPVCYWVYEDNKRLGKLMDGSVELWPQNSDCRLSELISGPDLVAPAELEAGVYRICASLGTECMSIRVVDR